MSGRIPSEAAVAVWVRLMRAQRVALQNVETDLRKAGLPPLGWYDALLELRRAGEAGLRPVELEARLLLAQPNVSRLVDRLHAAGLAERRPCDDDGRGRIVSLTAAGGALLDRMWPLYRAAIERNIGSRLEDEPTALRLADLLDRLAG